MEDRYRGRYFSFAAGFGRGRKAILLEVMRKSAGTANAGHEYRLLRPKLFVAAQRNKAVRIV